MHSRFQALLAAKQGTAVAAQQEKKWQPTPDQAVTTQGSLQQHQHRQTT
jgi:hypothetical protein